MIDDRAVERFRRAGQAAGTLAVGVARSGVAARMIVGEHDSGASVEHRIGDDPADRKLGAAFVAIVPRDVKAVRVIVEVCDPQAFAAGIGIRKTSSEEGACGCEPVEFER